MGENDVVVSQADAEHGAGEDGGDESLQLQLFFEWHSDLRAGVPQSRTPAAKLPSLAAGTGEVTRALFASTRFVYGQGTSLHLLAVQSVDGGLAGGGVAHRDETETAGAAGHAIVNQRHFGDGAVLFEKILKIVLGRIEGKISNVEFHVFEVWSNSLPATSRSRESGFKSPKSQTQLTIYQAKKQNRLNPMAGSVAQNAANTRPYLPAADSGPAIKSCLRTRTFFYSKANKLPGEKNYVATKIQ